MDIHESYATDPAAEDKGRWFENGDTEFLVARSGNRTYNDMFTVQLQAHKHTLDQRDTKEQREVANERAEKITIDVMSKAILLGWRGKTRTLDDGTVVTGQVKFKGEEISYNPGNAAKMLAVKDFRAWVNGKADDFKNYLISVQKADEKNSETSSSGN